MTYYYDDGSYEIFTNDPLDPFFFWSDTDQTWKWWVGWAVPDHDMWPEEGAELTVNGRVACTGPITVATDIKVWDTYEDQYVTLDSDIYSFRSLPHPCPHPPCAGATVPMQSTGTPLVVAALGLLSIICGVIYSKQK
jgi:hypothetical protein